MLKLLLLTVVAGAFADDTCPAFSPWKEWTSTCAWFPLSNLRDHFVQGCDIELDTSALPTLPTIPDIPGPCGHCPFKFRCRKRAPSEGCFPLEGEKEVCDEYPDVCDMPPFPLHNLGCRYEFAPYYLRQCVNRADLPDWKREGRLKLASIMPQFHCIDKDGQCKCCCHPYTPSKDGSQCVQHDMPECEPWTEWTEWSEKCLWLPPNEFKNDFAEHCDFKMKGGPKGDLLSKLKMPAGWETPDRCGYCSFKIKCRKRDVHSTDTKKKTCFPLDLEKKACGEDDCETCHTPCQVPKLMGSCNYTEHMKKIMGPGIRGKMKKLPEGMKMGLMKMISNLPHGKCVEIDGKCNCCCHPYEPSADGSTCELKDICKNPEDLGIEVDLKLEDNTFWFL